MISMARVPKSLVEEDTQSEIQLHDHVDFPLRYASLERVYSVSSSSSSSSSLCCLSAAGSHNVMSKKVKLPISDVFEANACPNDFELRPRRRPEIFKVYCRRKKRRRESFLELVMARNEVKDRKDGIVKVESVELDDNAFYEEEKKQKKKKRRIGNGELMKLGVDSTSLSASSTPRLRECRINAVCSLNKQNGSSRSKKTAVKNQGKLLSSSAIAKRWVRLSFDGVDPTTFIGLQCKASIEL